MTVLTYGMDDEPSPPTSIASQDLPPAVANFGSDSKIVRLALLFEGALVVLAILAGWLIKLPPWEQVRWRVHCVAIGLVAAVPMLIGLWFVRRIRRGPIGRLNAVVEDFLVPLFARCSIVELALISALAGLGEELLFRGVLQPVLIGWFGTAIGLLAASAVFGLLHSVTPTYAILATLIGVYFGGLVLWTENLLPPIIAHGVYDFAALVYLTRVAVPVSRPESG
jgi:membrane protease YdiL (CAAX protease family)